MRTRYPFGLLSLWLAMLTATWLSCCGCLQSNAARDFGEFVRVWPPEDETSDDSSGLNGQPSKNTSGSTAKGAVPKIAGGVSAAAKSQPATPSAGTSTGARANSAPSASAPPAAALATSAPSSAPAAHDPRLSAAQQSLLQTQLDALKQSTSTAAATSAAATPASAAGGEAPRATEKLSDYVATNRVAPAAATATSSPATAAQSAPLASTPSAAAAAPHSAADAATANAVPAATANAPTAATPTSSSPAATNTSTASPPLAPAPAPADAPAAVPASLESSSSSAAAEKPAENSVQGSSTAASSAKEGTAQDTSKDWSEHLQQSITVLEQKLGASDVEGAERLRLETTLRLLYVAANRREDAVRPIEQIEVPQQEFWKQTAYALMELMAPDGPPIASRRAKSALRSFREAIQQLAAISSLDVRNLAICQRVESFGRYTEFDPYEFQAGQEVILYVELSNFTAEKTADGYETELQGSYQVLDEQGRRLMDYDLPLDKQVCRNLRTDYFLPYRIYLPENLEAGAYKIQVTIEDKKSKKFGQTPPAEVVMVR